MIGKKSYIKQIILIIMIIMLIFNLNIVSYAEALNINADEEENVNKNEETNVNSNKETNTKLNEEANNISNEEVNIKSKQVTKANLTINVEYIYNSANNTVTAIMHSNNELKDTKPSWTLSADKLSYTKTFGVNDVYTTNVEDVNGNVTTVTIEITKILPTITVEYIKNNNNTVTAIMHSSEQLKDTKPSWELSADKLSYTKTFGANDNYTTDVEDIYGNVVTVRITITGIGSQEAFTITMEYKKNNDNTVTAIMHSNRQLKHTKPSWTLSEDKLSYTKTFGANDNYTTDVEDIYGNVVTVRITITGIEIQEPFAITVEYIKNDDNTVTAIMHSNRELKHTKPSWTLSEDKKSYSKTFGANDIYTTDVEDINGNITTVTIEITKILPTITVEYIKNRNNTVTAIMHSSEQLKDTKPSWTLSEDKLSYTKTFGANEDYTTDVEDIYGNIVTVHITITEIDTENPFKITVEYIKNDDNTVTAIMHSNRELKHTKPSWTLSADKLSYTKTFGANDVYTTDVEDINGNITTVTIEITQIIPTITLEYIKNDNNTVTVIMHSNSKLKDTKPSWTLSADGLSYTKIFGANDHYTTDVEDVYGHVVTVKIEVTKVAPTITVEYIRNSDNTVTAIMHSSEQLKHTKPSWTLSEDKKSYSKTFGANENYSFEVEDIYGNKTEVTITIFITNSSDFANLDESRYPGYKALLQEVQQKHPNWTIKIFYTGLDWNDVLNHEDGYDSNGSPYSLTQETGDWRSKTDLNGYEGGWYKASREAIAYMMDPRNSLDQYYIFQFQNLSSTDGVYSDIEKMINGTYLANNYNKANIINAFLSASKNYNVSAYHLVSRMIQEQTNGWCANGYQYKGRTVYNFANIKATGSTTEEIIRNGAEYAYNNHWFTPEMCIQGTAAFLYNNYFKNGQNTQYFQKYNVVTSDPYTNQYMQNIRAANDEGYRVAKAYESNGQLDLHFEFAIPVYENMPSAASPRPNT